MPIIPNTQDVNKIQDSTIDKNMQNFIAPDPFRKKVIFTNPLNPALSRNANVIRILQNNP